MKKIYQIKGVADEKIHPEIMDYLASKFEIVRRLADAECLTILGGDGRMLKSVRQYRELGLPFFGLNYGSVGFLLNAPTVETLEDLLCNRLTVISARMLQAELYDKSGQWIKKEFALNDFYFERSTTAGAKIRVSINDRVKFDPLCGDGVIAATAIGSTAYTASAHGKILPIGSKKILLTGICPATRHHWRTETFDSKTKITLEMVENEKRPLRFLADGVQIKKVARAEISYSDKVVRLLFAKSQDFRKKRLEFIF